MALIDDVASVLDASGTPYTRLWLNGSEVLLHKPVTPELTHYTSGISSGSGLVARRLHAAAAIGKGRLAVNVGTGDFFCWRGEIISGTHDPGFIGGTNSAPAPGTGYDLTGPANTLGGAWLDARAWFFRGLAGPTAVALPVNTTNINSFRGLPGVVVKSDDVGGGPFSVLRVPNRTDYREYLRYTSYPDFSPTDATIRTVRFDNSVYREATVAFTAAQYEAAWGRQLPASIGGLLPTGPFLDGSAVIPGATVEFLTVLVVSGQIVPTEYATYSGQYPESLSPSRPAGTRDWTIRGYSNHDIADALGMLTNAEAAAVYGLTHLTSFDAETQAQLAQTIAKFRENNFWVRFAVAKTPFVAKRLREWNPAWRDLPDSFMLVNDTGLTVKGFDNKYAGRESRYICAPYTKGVAVQESVYIGRNPVTKLWDPDPDWAAYSDRIKSGEVSVVVDGLEDYLANSYSVPADLRDLLVGVTDSSYDAAREAVVKWPVTPASASFAELFLKTRAREDRNFVSLLVTVHNVCDVSVFGAT